MKLSTTCLLVALQFSASNSFTLQDHAHARAWLEGNSRESQSLSSPSRLWTSMSTMNMLEEDQEDTSRSSSTTASSLSSSSSSTLTMSKPSSSSDVVDWDWKAVASNVFSEEDQRPIVLFDGVCTLCDASVNFFMDHDSKGKLRFCGLHSKVAQSLLIRAGKKPTDKNQMVLVTKDKTYFSSEAVSRICQHLDPVPLQLIGTIGKYTPKFIRESIYKVVSANRHRLGQNDSCRLDFDGEFTSRFVSDPVELSEV